MSWFVYVVRLGERFTEFHRDWILHQVASRHIACGGYFAPIHLQPIYRAASQNRAELPVTEWNANRTLTLPFFTSMRNEQVDEICRNLAELIDSARDLKLETKPPALARP